MGPTSIGMHIGLAVELPALMLEALRLALELYGVDRAANAIWLRKDRDIRNRWSVDKLLALETRRLHAYPLCPHAATAPSKTAWINQLLRSLKREVKPQHEWQGIIPREGDLSSTHGEAHALFRTAIEALQSIEERWDGRGRPGKLRGPSIPLLARIAFLAIALDALASELGRAAAIEVVGRQSGQWFDPSLVSTVEDLYNLGDLNKEGCMRTGSPTIETDG